MNNKTLPFFAVSLLFSNVAMAISAPLSVAVPLEDGGILVIAAACLTVGIRMIQRKRNR